MLGAQEFKVQNMVGSCDVKFPIRLEGLASTHTMFCSVSHLVFGRGGGGAIEGGGSTVLLGSPLVPSPRCCAHS